MHKHQFPSRSISGVLLLDKSLEITSNQALQRVKRLYQAKKAGHTGSLDPLAHGMLPICLGEATKFSHFLLESDKEYKVIAKLGEITATGDAEGPIIEKRDIYPFSEQELIAVLNRFKGAITQTPPMYSALKHQGQPLYELARKGITVERKSRQIHIYDLQLVEYSLNQLTLRVKCSKGTYIRSLVEDIGLALGCGAHVVHLRRVSVAHFKAEHMVTDATLQLVKKGNRNTVSADTGPE